MITQLITINDNSEHRIINVFNCFVMVLAFVSEEEFGVSCKSDLVVDVLGYILILGSIVGYVVGNIVGVFDVEIVILFVGVLVGVREGKLVGVIVGVTVGAFMNISSEYIYC
mmetsp:Transcript_34172/g.42073  ORF Transcript_34172/g.42073 Transcript_34172/m.42073 type:complete len:112 (-) Transcript_34172:468-803(-)